MKLLPSPPPNRLLRSCRSPSLAAALIGASLAPLTLAAAGAPAGWTTYEAEAMRTSGEVLGPAYLPYRVETESSGQRCVKLAGAGDYLEFTAADRANALVVRYSLPDAPGGGGVEGGLTLEVNGRAVRRIPLTSRYARLYGNYPFSNDPRAGQPRNFYDEARVRGLAIAPGDVIRLEQAGAAPSCIVDLVDLESVAAPLPAPAHSYSVADFGAGGGGATDDTGALRRCVAAAAAARGTVWLPPGDYRITGDIVVPSFVTIQGAGMWHTTLVGDPALYPHADRRVRLKLSGDHIRLADFAILGRLNYRDDREPNDGIVSTECSDATISRVWIEHTKAGIWLYNGRRLRIEGCRFRDTLADGVNLCVGTRETVVQDSTARGTGDDCFAIWPAPADQGFFERWRPGDNVIRRCTGQLPFLANGGAIYGGADNRIEDCRFTDITAGCGLLISTTFPTADAERHRDNNFSGTTVVRNLELIRCGGYDHDWAWRGSFQICLDRRSISGLSLADIAIRDSLSDGLTVVAPGSATRNGTLSRAQGERITISNCGLAGGSHHSLWVRRDAEGSIILTHCEIPDVKNDSAAFAIVRE